MLAKVPSQGILLKTDPLEVLLLAGLEKVFLIGDHLPLVPVAALLAVGGRDGGPGGTGEVKVEK